MPNTLGENIRRLRRLHEITQETLAEALNVTIPAVSKWERGDSMPDVSMIVPIASYFGVTTDELLGVSEERKKQKIQAWYDWYKPYIWHETKEVSQKHFDDLLALMKEYPNDFELLTAYCRSAVLDPEFFGQRDQIEQSRRKNYRRIEDACRTIIEKCTDECRRQDAFSDLAELYAFGGELEKGEELIDANIPFEIRAWKTAKLYESVHHPDTPAKYRTCLFWQMVFLYQNLTAYIEWIDDADERLELCRRCLTMLDAFAGDDSGEFCFYKADVYFAMSGTCIRDGRFDDGVKYAELCLRYSRMYDELPKEHICRTGFMKGLGRTMTDSFEGTDMTNVRWMIGIYEQPWTEKIREREDFRRLLNEYRNV